MKVEILRSFLSTDLKRVCKHGEIIEGNEEWCRKVMRQRYAKEIIEPSQIIRDLPELKETGKKTIRLRSGKLEIFTDRVFLTGHKGYLGDYILKDLSQDYEVIGYDLKLKQDILDYNHLVKEMAGCQIVIHGAAIPHPISKYKFEDYFRVNVLGTLNVLKAAVENKVSKFIYLCSGTVYGWDTQGKITPLYFPIDESHPPLTSTMQFEGKLDSYAQSKLIAEQILAWYGTNEYFQAISLRMGPVVPKANFFKEGKEIHPHRLKTFWVNTEPETVARAVRLALETKIKSNFEIFNVVEKETHPEVDLVKYLEEHYPNVPIKGNWKPPQNLLSIEKAEGILGL